MKATFIPVVAALAGMASAATAGKPLALRQDPPKRGHIDEFDAAKDKGTVTNCANEAFKDGAPSPKDCEPVIQWYRDNQDGLVDNAAPAGSQETIYCLGDCALQLFKENDVDIKNGAIADAAQKIVDTCSDGGDGASDGELVAGEGDGEFWLAVLPRWGGACKWD